MNLSTHVRVTPNLHIQMSVEGHPELTRVIGVPADAPSYWVVEAYQLSLGIEPEAPEFDGADEPWPLIVLTPWRATPQRVTIPGVADAVDVEIVGPFAAQMGDPRVTIISAGSADRDTQPDDLRVMPLATHHAAHPDDQLDDEAEPAGRGQPNGLRGDDRSDPDSAGSKGEDRSLEETASEGWQTGRPVFRAELLAFELAQRFGLVQPHFDTDVAGDLVPGLRASSAVARLSESLPPARRLALLAHLEASGVLAPRPLDAAMTVRATAGLRSLVARIGADGVEQNQADGWLPRAVVNDTIDSLGWSNPPAAGLVAPGGALVGLARRTKSIRRLRGRVVVTNLGRTLAAGELRAFPRITEIVGNIGREGIFSYGQPRQATLALLALADGTAATFRELVAVVALGEAAIALVPGGTWRYSESAMRSYRDHAHGGDDPHAVQRLIECLCALSDPEAYGEITPAMRVIARAALR